MPEKALAIRKTGLRHTVSDVVEISGFVLKSVLTQADFGLIFTRCATMW